MRDNEGLAEYTIRSTWRKWLQYNNVFLVIPEPIFANIGPTEGISRLFLLAVSFYFF